MCVYEDGFDGMPWVPSGVMGNANSLTVDGDWSENVAQGTHVIRLHYSGRKGWAGVAWQHPADNWGEMDGGFDLTGATALEFLVRGETGKEEASFSVGLLGEKTDFPDSVIVKTGEIKLAPEWRRYRIDFEEGDDLSSIKVAFVVSLVGRRP